MTSVRIYGHFTGNSSLAVVSRGMHFGLSHFMGGVRVDASLSRSDLDFEEEIDPDELPEGSDARHGVFVGGIGKLPLMFERGRHEHYWVMLTPNSNKIPEDLVAMIRSFRDKYPRRVHLISPSRWSTQIVEHYLEKCTTVPHGVDPEYKPDLMHASILRTLYREGQFRVAHFSTSDRERKGTLELLKAWPGFVDLCYRSYNVTPVLALFLDRAAEASLRERMMDEGLSPEMEGLIFRSRVNAPPETMANILRGAHLVCQPSRGEGFGLIPLQARACGTPVAATACTGHADHFPRYDDHFTEREDPSRSVIATGKLAPIDDVPGAEAPSLDPVDIQASLEDCYRSWAGMHYEALLRSDSLGREWSWPVKLKPFFEILQAT